MSLCLNCNYETKNPKFCSRSCAASYNGKFFPKRQKEGQCLICNTKISSSRTYCSNICMGKGIALYRKKSNLTSYDHVKMHRQKVKLKAIDYKGGKCYICGYNKNPKALAFHHLDPNEKEFTISAKSHLSWDRIQEELDKCILLCMNCHAEFH